MVTGMATEPRQTVKSVPMGDLPSLPGAPTDQTESGDKVSWKMTPLRLRQPIYSTMSNISVNWGENSNPDFEKESCD
jgi:hypothetical protein